MALNGPEGTAHGGFSEVKALQEELARLMSSLGRAHEKMAQVALAAGDSTHELRAKIEELEGQNLTLVLRNRELEDENAELRGLLEVPEPGVEAIVKERDVALKEAEAARKTNDEMGETIEELLDALRAYRAAAAGCTCKLPNQPQDSSSVGRTQIQQRTPADSDDDRATIRQQARPVPNTPARRAATPQVQAVASSSKTQLDSATRAPLTPAPSQEVVSTASAGSSQQTWDSPSSASRAAAAIKRLWYLEFTNPPSSAELQHGPIPFDILAEKLDLSEDVQFEVTSLGAMHGYDTRIFARSDVAFVYEPVILEGPGPTASYFVGWTTPDRVQSVKDWVAQTGDLQLFIWPIGETVGWRYIGLHSLSFADIECKWPMIHATEKKLLLEHLGGRNGPEMDAAKFRKDVRKKRLVQVCIQLESKGEMESEDFLREYGLLA
ncbi:hypothetical protein FKP32DRAFT_1673940 [Trametes sanguinea]|nr:hypothetical protein FKP32DRAFT_1673940 [Trametes sanguinea]